MYPSRMFQIRSHCDLPRFLGPGKVNRMLGYENGTIEAQLLVWSTEESWISKQILAQSTAVFFCYVLNHIGERLTLAGRPYFKGISLGFGWRAFFNHWSD